MWGQIGLKATFNSGMDTFTPALTYSIINGQEKFNTIEENGNDRPYSSFNLTASPPSYVASPTGISDSRLSKYNFIVNFVIDSLSATVGNKNLVLQQFFIDSDGEEFGHLDYISSMTKSKRWNIRKLFFVDRSGNKRLGKLRQNSWNKELRSKNLQRFPFKQRRLSNTR